MKIFASNNQNVQSDLSKVLVSSLPVCFNGTHVLLHLVKESYINNPKFNSLGKTGYGYSGNIQNRSNENYVDGRINNVVFENIETNEKKLLVNTPI